MQKLADSVFGKSKVKVVHCLLKDCSEQLEALVVKGLVNQRKLLLRKLYRNSHGFALVKNSLVNLVLRVEEDFVLAANCLKGNYPLFYFQFVTSLKTLLNAEALYFRFLFSVYLRV